VSLPVDHSFVVQLRAGSGVDAEGPWRGRVEHVVSGRAAHFDDWGALRVFLVQTLHECAERAQTNET
jgi:hypothetical protein